MKVLIFLLAVLFGVWLWRRNRLSSLKEKQQEKSNSSSSQASTHAAANLQQPSPMHACDHCGVHLPESDMVKGRSGRFCTEAHRQAAGDPPS